MALIDVVKCDCGPNTFAWKFPNSELSTGTQVIVNESQEAILFKGGQALDIFGPGRHTLSTKNIPLLSKLINLPFGGQSPFTAEVWYINKVSSLDIKWGTPTPIPLFDPFLMVDVKVRSFGQFGIRIENSRKFLEQLVGTLPVFTADRLTTYFKGEYLKQCSSVIGRYFTEKKIGILQVNSALDDLSSYIYEVMNGFFDNYGIQLINFSINNISVDENDESYQAVKAAMASSAKTRWESTAKTDAAAYEQERLGYTYQEKRSFDVMGTVAENSGGGNGNQFMEMGMGLAMGSQMGTMVGTQMGNMAAVMQVDPKKVKQCPKCNGQIGADERFCHHCGADTTIKEEPKPTIKKCISCNADIGENMKFCPECGTIQQPKCPKCGIDVGPRQKFCHECGAKVKED